MGKIFYCFVIIIFLFSCLKKIDPSRAIFQKNRPCWMANILKTYFLILLGKICLYFVIIIYLFDPSRAIFHKKRPCWKTNMLKTIFVKVLNKSFVFVFSALSHHISEKTTMLIEKSSTNSYNKMSTARRYITFNMFMFDLCVLNFIWRTHMRFAHSWENTFWGDNCNFRLILPLVRTSWLLYVNIKRMLIIFLMCETFFKTYIEDIVSVGHERPICP